MTVQTIDTEALVRLGELVLAAGRVQRVTYHGNGRDPESVTDHTVMLAVVGCAFAPLVDDRLDVGRVAQYALVHDLVEVYAGDTNTLRALDEAAKADKRHRETLAYVQIAERFGLSVPWLVSMIARYEGRADLESRYVKALDKLMPKVTHLLNGGATLGEQNMSYDELRGRYQQQRAELREYAADFPVLLDLHAQLVERVLALYLADDR